MAHKKPEGSFVALITPMNQDGSIDFEGFKTLIDWHAENGTEALLIMGSTGEVSMLSPEERREIVEKTVKMKPAGVDMYYGCSGNNTATTIKYVQHAKTSGADGAIIAAAVLVSVPLGISTALAVAAHQIPQEVGDFAILLNAGYSRQRALWLNAFSASSAVVGAIVVYAAAETLPHTLPYLLALAAGPKAGRFR